MTGGFLSTTRMRAARAVSSRACRIPGSEHHGYYGSRDPGSGIGLDADLLAARKAYRCWRATASPDGRADCPEYAGTR